MSLVVTDEFSQLAATERLGLGMVGLPLAVIQHPLGDQPAEVVEARADAAIEAIVHNLTTPADDLAGEERRREYPEPKSIFRNKPIFA